MKSFMFILVTLFSLYAVQDDNNVSHKEKNSFGIELNPLMVSVGYLSAGVNYFNDSYEIAVPFTYNQGFDEYLPYNSVEANIDIHFRKFLKSLDDGLYLGVFTRLQYYEGKLQDSRDLASIYKLGYGFEAGLRWVNLFGYDSLYYGMSLGMGRYLGDFNDKLESYSIFFEDNHSVLFYNIELFKIGYMFWEKEMFWGIL